MAYQTIATKYRPQVFSDLIGQEPVSLALLGSVAQGRIPSGAIFSGTRGVGKTSVARIYAKALNCDDSSSPEACGHCESCEAISLGTHEDVIEIDGASNNGVDEVRALKETMVYVPQRSRYRIYIIDEVHMLSMSAFNALLKTLEEPPSYTVFLFATTEIEKVPQTVLSRCQTFYLHKISLKDIAARVEFILSKEGISWEEGLLPFLAKEGRGSLRDALTFLDQLIAISGTHLTKASLEKIVGSLSQEDYLSLLGSLLEKNSKASLEQIGLLDERSESFIKIVNRLALLTRHGFILKSLSQKDLKEEFCDLEESDVVQLKILADRYTTRDFNDLFQVFVSCLDSLRDSFLDRYVFENACLSWCLQGEVQRELLVVQPEKKLTQEKQPPKSLKVQETITSDVTATLSAPGLHSSVSEEKKEEKEEKPALENDGSFPESWRDLVTRWKQVKPLQARKLEEVIPHEYSPQRIVLLVDENSLVGPTFLKEETRKKVALVLAKLFGFKGQLVVRSRSDVASSSSGENENKAQLVAPVESLLDEKNRFHKEREKKTEHLLKENPLVKGLSERFKAQIIETHIDV